MITKNMAFEMAKNILGTDEIKLEYKNINVLLGESLLSKFKGVFIADSFTMVNEELPANIEFLLKGNRVFYKELSVVDTFQYQNLAFDDFNILNVAVQLMGWFAYLK